METSHRQLSSTTVQEYDLYDPFQYPWMSLNFFLAFWLASDILRKALCMINANNIARSFHELVEDKKRNVIIYILQFVVTLFAFILQIYGGTDILFHLSDTTTLPKLNAMVLAMLCVAVLYIWELCYREKIGWPLLVHHLVTLILIQCSTASFFDTQNILYIRYAMLLGFHATTEQISFLALFCFRLAVGIKYHDKLFYAAAIQAFVMKTFVTVFAFVIFILDGYVNNEFENDPTHWGVFWKVCFLPLLVLLYASQLFACNILFSLGRRCHKTKAMLDKAVQDLPKATSPEQLSQLIRRASIAPPYREHCASVNILDALENASDNRFSIVNSSGTNLGGRSQSLSNNRRRLTDDMVLTGSLSDGAFDHCQHEMDHLEVLWAVMKTQMIGAHSDLPADELTPCSDNAGGLESTFSRSHTASLPALGMVMAEIEDDSKKHLTETPVVESWDIEEGDVTL